MVEQIMILGSVAISLGRIEAYKFVVVVTPQL